MIVKQLLMKLSIFIKRTGVFMLVVSGMLSAYPLLAQTQTPQADTYPAEALRRGEQGRVVLNLVISTIGRVKTCAVAESSGSTSLDADACEKALGRVRFTPAKDSDGNAVESKFTLPMRYVLPKK